MADSSSPTQFATANLSIVIDNTLQVTTTSLPEAIDGVPYSTTVLAAGGTLPYTFSLSAGGLFPGLSLSTSGVISGTVPNGNGGATAFDLRVTDSSNPPQSVVAGLILTVVEKLSIKTNTLPGATLGVPYSATIVVAGGNPPYSSAITRGTLPQGLTLNGSTISGTPSGSAGTSNFVYEVVDSGSPQQTAMASLSITVSSSPQKGASGQQKR